MIVVFGVMVYPIMYAVWLSLFQSNPILPGRPFVGLGNYVAMAHDPEFWHALGRTFYFVAVSLIVETIAGLAIAVVLNAEFVGRRLVRAIAIVPWAVPTIVNGLLWSWIYNPDYGALNGLLKALGVIQNNVNWLGSPGLALNMVIIADAWRETPFYVILFLAGLQVIPQELYNAAAVDGATMWQTFARITLPLLQPALLLILILRTLETFRVFSIIYILTRGGPANGTMVLGYLAYQQTFSFLNFGYGSAMSVAITAATIVLTLFYLRALALRVEY
ncbi:MAG TPA: sugar ABC transporter permease [bacterium]|nr:sugar ABC transporter permease [bacterium]